ncbi:MAG: hypothetical protein ICV74_02635 [Thermoleophilia bacterium]|nr:hypothetical protein [Thermoleophilia bacterium]
MSAEETYTGADEAAESEASEEAGVEEIEAKTSLSPEERQRADEQARAEIEDLARRGEGEPLEELFELDGEAGTRAGPGAGPLRLSANFVLSEFHCKDAQRTPVPAVSVPALRRLARNVLQPMRNRFGTCTVNSGFRTDAKNAEVGGVPRSQHLYHRTPRDVAADVTFATGTPRDWAREADRLLPQGGVGQYTSFVHVDNRTTRARWTGSGVT